MKEPFLIYLFLSVGLWYEAVTKPSVWSGVLASVFTLLLVYCVIIMIAKKKPV